MIWDVRDRVGSESRVRHSMPAEDLCEGCGQTETIVAYGICPSEATTMYAIAPVCAGCYRTSAVRDAHYFERDMILVGCLALRETQAGETQGLGR